MSTSGLAYVRTEFGILSSRSWPSLRTPGFDGISLDLSLQRDETIRYQWDSAQRIAKREGWESNSIFEIALHEPTIYRLPLYTMVNAYRLEDFRGHGTDARRFTTEAYRAEEETREQYRRTHRNAEDPVRAHLDRLVKSLPKHPRNARTVYLAADYTLFRRRLGIFTTFEQAEAAVPRRATILEVRADGRTSDSDARLVRGEFRHGWGYASGYAPDVAVPLRGR